VNVLVPEWDKITGHQPLGVIQIAAYSRQDFENRWMFRRCGQALLQPLQAAVVVVSPEPDRREKQPQKRQILTSCFQGVSQCRTDMSRNGHCPNA
jgi:hypothetical protein